MAPEHGRLDVRTDDDFERILDWLGARTGYTRSQLVRWTCWLVASRIGMPDLPPLRRLLSVRPGRRPKVERNGRHSPPAAPEET